MADHNHHGALSRACVCAAGTLEISACKKGAQAQKSSSPEERSRAGCRRAPSSRGRRHGQVDHARIAVSRSTTSAPSSVRFSPSQSRRASGSELTDQRARRRRARTPRDGDAHGCQQRRASRASREGHAGRVVLISSSRVSRLCIFGVAISTGLRRAVARATRVSWRRRGARSLPRRARAVPLVEEHGRGALINVRHHLSDLGFLHLVRRASRYASGASAALPPQRAARLVVGPP